MDLKVTTHGVRQIVADNPYLSYKRVTKQIKLTKKHKMDRYDFEVRYLGKSRVDTPKLIISDVKKFRKTGSDGFDYH